MNKLKMACFASLFAAGIAQASTPCDGFEIKIKNSLPDDLLVTKIDLQGGELQPGGIQKVDGKSEQVFTVNNTGDAVMKGSLTFHTISLPSKTVKVQFDLENSGLICEHTDTSPASDYNVEKTRLPGKVNYTISAK